MTTKSGSNEISRFVVRNQPRLRLWSGARRDNFTNTAAKLDPQRVRRHGGRPGLDSEDL